MEGKTSYFINLEITIKLVNKIKVQHKKFRRAPRAIMLSESSKIHACAHIYHHCPLKFMTQPHGGNFSLSSLKYPKISCEPMEKNNNTQTKLFRN